ncbi:tetratricopeptide repeat (TPR)-containing protein [Abeliophyllum distichum]|uniref:Tetratricopeptide repeat (TPR)-containing protein n=1 Tax=Abeliophyllum distichum TaxID=126358 RepID=A0ABD1QT70_9LAMI
MRSLKMMEGCKGTQVYSVNNPTTTNGGGAGGGVGEKFLQHLQDHLRVNPNWSKSHRRYESLPGNYNVISSDLAEALANYGLPQLDLMEPQIEPCLKFVHFVEILADAYRKMENCPQFERSGLYLEQCAIFRGLPDLKLFRRCLTLARQHAVDVHSKVMLSAWLRYDRREDELIGVTAMDCCGRIMECSKSSLVSGYNPESANDPCSCPLILGESGNPNFEEESMECSTSFSLNDDEDEYDMYFCIGDDEVKCNRYNMASLSRPFKAMLYGSFMESQRERIYFTQNEISAKGMRAAEMFSRTNSVDSFDPNVVLELLLLANRFCCEEMKSTCDAHLASLVDDMDSAMLLIEYGLEETAYLLVAACLQVFLRELPYSMHNPNVIRLFCSSEAHERLALVGHASFLLYSFLSKVGSG